MGRRRGLLLGAVALVLAACGGNDDGGSDASDEVRLEPIGVAFETDFVVDLDPRAVAGTSLAIALPDVPPLGAAVGGLIGASGDEPGLYGGSRDIATCDVEQMIEFLTDPDNAALAEAWAEVHDIEVDDLAEFIGNLTPVRLRFDTRVTNHGFSDGRATPIQSVLEAGTAVLVDERGVPVAKCACGNPLLPPGTGGSLANVEDSWDGFSLAEVVEVEPGALTREFVLVDVDDGVLFERPVGTDGEADRLLPPGGALCGVFVDSPTCSGREGTPDVDMPDLAGSDPAAARRLLEALGFVGDVSERVEPSDRPAGVVIGSEPPAGRTVPAKSPIVLLVSAGPDDEPVTTTGSTAPSTTTSTTTGRTTSTSTSTTSTSTSTTTSSTTTTTQGVVVPDVRGKPEASAREQLETLGFEVVSQDDTSPSNFPDGTVKAQNPAGGTTAAPGSIVTIFVHREVIE